MKQATVAFNVPILFKTRIPSTSFLHYGHYDCLENNLSRIRARSPTRSVNTTGGVENQKELNHVRYDNFHVEKIS